MVSLICLLRACGAVMALSSVSRFYTEVRVSEIVNFVVLWPLLFVLTPYFILQTNWNRVIAMKRR